MVEKNDAKQLNDSFAFDYYSSIVSLIDSETIDPPITAVFN